MFFLKRRKRVRTTPNGQLVPIQHDDASAVLSTIAEGPSTLVPTAIDSEGHVSADDVTTFSSQIPWHEQMNTKMMRTITTRLREL